MTCKKIFVKTVDAEGCVDPYGLPAGGGGFITASRLGQVSAGDGMNSIAITIIIITRYPVNRSQQEARLSFLFSSSYSKIKST